MNLDTTCTQEQFGQLVGISQQAVSDLLARNVLQPGDIASKWLLDYAAHFREQAAGRGSDGKLADERARLARAQTEKVERQNKIASGQFADVGLIAAVLSTVGRRVASILEALPEKLHKMFPELTGETLKMIHAELSKAGDVAANASLEDLDVPDEPASEDADSDEFSEEGEPV